MNSPSSMSQRVCDAARKCCPRCSVRQNTIIFVFGCYAFQAPQFPSLDVVSCGHCSPNFCVDHSYSGFIFTHCFPFSPPGTLSPWCNRLAAWRTSAFRGWPWLRSLGTGAAGGDPGTGCCWTLKTKTVVKISFLLLSLTGHFFFFANTTFLRFVFFCIHSRVFQ